MRAQLGTARLTSIKNICSADLVHTEWLFIHNREKLVSANDDLAHSLKIKFGLAPAEPTPVQLAAIKAIISRITASGRRPTENDWYTAVTTCCPDAGSHRYSGVDNSDLNTLLALAAQSAQGGL